MMKQSRIHIPITISAVLIAGLLFSGTIVKADWKSDADARIEQIRKRNAEITVVDHNGQPVQNVGVQIQQVKHHFAFGSALDWYVLFYPDFQNFFLNHFEWAVCEYSTKWEAIEPDKDVESYYWPDNIYNWCNSNGITMRGHCLFWEQDTHVQQWVKDLNYATYPAPSELLDQVDEHIDHTVDHFKNELVHWDIDNEMISNAFYDRLGEAGRVHMFQRAHQVDPNCKLFMNEYNGNSFGSYYTQGYIERANSLLSMGAPIHALGLQGHLVAETPFDPQRYYDNVLEPLRTQVGLPLWITEFDTSESDVTQRANNLENFFRICFSHPSVEGILMWGFWESAHWRDNAFLVDASWNINAAGLRYESLLNEWTTHDFNTTSSSGKMSFRGFHGTYEITLTAPNQTSEVYTIELEPGTPPEQFELVTDIIAPESDFNAPTPDPMTWAAAPEAISSSRITMTATTASDPPYGVEYYFDCITAGGHDSNWQDGTFYQDISLSPNTQYTYRVKARDKSPNHNETGWSSELSATTEPSSDVEILGSWVSGLNHPKEPGTNRALILIAHAESSGPISLDYITYGGRYMFRRFIVMTSGGSGTQQYVIAFLQGESGIVAATNGTFVPTWSGTPENVAYESVFLANVEQRVPTEANDTNGTTGDTPNPIQTNPLRTDGGDMVIVAATCGNPTGTYTINNGFTKAIEQSMSSSNSAAGFKLATGLLETPSVTYGSAPNGQVIAGFVVQSVANPPPAAPTGLAATAGNHTVSLNWNDNMESDMNGYNVYRSTISGSGYARQNVSLVSSSTYVDTNNITNGTPYYYVVTAVDTNSSESDYSDEDSGTGFRLDADISGTGDGYVNYEDLDTFAEYWLRDDCASLDNCHGADFTPTDGAVNFIDFSTFGLQWMQCNDPENLDCP